MVLFIISRLLLLTLLLRETVEGQNRRMPTSPGDDSSVQFGEFCLRFPDDSHRSDAEPSTPPSTDLAHPTKQPTEQPFEDPIGNPTRDAIEDSTEQPVDDSTEHPVEDSTEWNMEWPADWPTEELFEDLIKTYIEEPIGLDIDEPSMLHSYPNVKQARVDNLRQVGPSQAHNGCRCTRRNTKQPDQSTVRHVRTWYPNETCRLTQSVATLADGSMVCVSSFMLLPFFEDLLSWIAPEAEPTPEEKITESLTIPQPDYVANVSQLDLDIGHCKRCLPSLTNNDDFDVEDVQSLHMRVQPFPCLANIDVMLKDNKVFCSTLVSFKPVLQELERSLLHVWNSDETSGCRCTLSTTDHPTDTTPVESITIWLPKENCEVTEIMERLIDGRERCRKASNLVQYLEAFDHSVFNGQISHQVISRPSGGATAKKTCALCWPIENGNSPEPSSFRSLEVRLPPPSCPAIIHVALKDGPDFCVDSSQPGFRDLLKEF